MGHGVGVMGSWGSSHCVVQVFLKSPTSILQVSYMSLTSLINTRVMGYGGMGHGVGVMR